jgi:hypothetical protein
MVETLHGRSAKVARVIEFFYFRVQGLERQVILESLHRELLIHEIAKWTTSFIKEEMWRVVQVWGKYRKVLDHRSSGIVVTGSRGYWTVDLSRGRFWHFGVVAPGHRTGHMKRNLREELQSR